jgi:hypothetical protein
MLVSFSTFRHVPRGLSAVSFRCSFFPTARYICRLKSVSSSDPVSTSRRSSDIPTFGNAGGSLTLVDHHVTDMWYLATWQPLLQSIPWACCSSLSCQIVLPEQEQTVLSLSHTPALLAMTPTSVSGSSFEKGPYGCFETTMLRPITSQIDSGLSRKALPVPS